MIGLLVFAAIAVVPADTTFICTPERVYDGDGPIWCSEGPRVRLGGVAAREMDETCRPLQPCPTASAIEARDALVMLLGGASGVAPEGHILVAGRPLTCISDGSAGGSRTAAWCSLSDGRSLNCTLIATGKVLDWPRYMGVRKCRGTRLTKTQ